MEPGNFRKRMFKLAEAHKKEKHRLDQRIIQLQKKLEDKQHLELEIELGSGVGGLMPIFEGGSGDADAEAKKKIESLKKNLEEKEKHIEDLTELNQVLIIKERKLNDEVQNARKVLIDGLKDMPNSKADIGVKRMGDLDYDQILAAAKEKYPADQAEEKAMEFATRLVDKLKNTHWYPFKNLMVGEDLKEVIDEEDDFIKDIKKEWGAEVYNAVVTTLTEMNKYYPGGSYPVPELWNFVQGRSATIGECVEFILRLLKNRKRKGSCCTRSIIIDVSGRFLQFACIICESQNCVIGSRPYAHYDMNNLLL